MVKSERNRYILFQIIKENDLRIEPKEILNSMWKSIWKFFGMKEANKVGLWLIQYDPEIDLGLIRCSHYTKELIISALALVNNISGKRVILSPIRTSGTIRSIKKFHSSLKS
jgi:ribonuclease P/MRP protein subunit POP5